MGRFTSGEEDFSNVKTLMGTERFEVDFFSSNTDFCAGI